MECPHCHVENVEGARFCLSCGQPLAGRSGAAIRPDQAVGRGARLIAKILDQLIWLIPAWVLITVGAVSALGYLLMLGFL